MVSELAQFIDKLDSQTLETVNAIRSVISDSHPGLTESIKWNAPSFSVNGEDRITLGLERKGGALEWCYIAALNSKNLPVSVSMTAMT